MSCSSDGCRNKPTHEVLITALDGVGELRLCDEHLQQFRNSFGDDPAVEISTIPQGAGDAAAPEGSGLGRLTARASRLPG